MRRGFAPFFRQVLAADVSPALRRAHEMMSMGEYAHAATAFEQLAHVAEARNALRAPHLHLQAGRARLLNRQPALALPHFRRGLEMLLQSGRYMQAYRLGQRVVQELRQHNLEREAREIAALVSSSIPAIAELPTERGPDVSTVLLPAHCDSCGGPIRSPEVEWLDARTAECPYCGSPVRAL